MYLFDVIPRYSTLYHYRYREDVQNKEIRGPLASRPLRKPLNVKYIYLFNGPTLIIRGDP